LGEARGRLTESIQKRSQLEDDIGGLLNRLAVNKQELKKRKSEARSG